MYYIISFILHSRKCELIYGERKYISGFPEEWTWKTAGGEITKRLEET